MTITAVDVNKLEVEGLESSRMLSLTNRLNLLSASVRSICCASGIGAQTGFERCGTDSAHGLRSWGHVSKL
ncbi:unnamed protein product [Calypogeia fissa]